MPDWSTLVYLYDGTFGGLLTAVFEAFDKRETPSEITDCPDTLLTVRNIATDDCKAERVIKGITNKLGKRALDNVRVTYLSSVKGKERRILDYVRFGFQNPKILYTAVANPAVAPINAAVKKVHNEAHRMKEFVRFSDYGNALVSTIEPVNNVLPLIVEHFCNRLPQENFMLYDALRGLAFVHTPTEQTFTTVEELSLPPETEEEKKFRALWQLFYDTVEIQARHNPALRRQHCPKYYWKHMPEMPEDK